MQGQEFDAAAWLAALQESFNESIQITMRDFATELSEDPAIDQEALVAALHAVEHKMLWSVQVNIDRLENFYNENNTQPSDEYTEILKKLEHRAVTDGNYTERVENVFREIQASCGEFSVKKQRYLKFCLYDKYLAKERTLGLSEGESGEFFDLRVREQQIHAKAKQENEFLKDFAAYVELFGNMQTDLLRKLQ